MVRGVTVEEEGVRAAYEDVRDDNTETAYAFFTYSEDNSTIKLVLVLSVSLISSPLFLSDIFFLAL